jgi:hypothetical protein
MGDVTRTRPYTMMKKINRRSTKGKAQHLRLETPVAATHRLVAAKGGLRPKSGETGAFALRGWLAVGPLGS